MAKIRRKTMLLRIPERDVRKYDRRAAEVKMNRNQYFVELLKGSDLTHDAILRKQRNHAIAKLKKTNFDSDIR